MTSALDNKLAPQIHTLPNGLRVVAEHLPYVHSVSVGVWIKTGSANESAEIAGISHFLEHMLFKGTPTRSSRDLMEIVESRGGHMNAFTSKEYTCLYIKTLSQHLESGLDVLSDIIKNCIYSDLEKERNVILEEIASGIDVPDEHIHDLIAEKVWPSHPLGRPIAGSHETVSNTHLEHIKTYKEHWYCPENMLLSIVGQFDETAIMDQFENFFGDMAEGTIDHVWDTPTAQSGLVWEERDIAQNHLLLSFPGTSVYGDKRYHFDMLSSVFGGGSTSRLFDSIREEAGLAYSIYSYNSIYSQTGALGVYAAIAPENLGQTLGLISDEMKKLQDEVIGEDELNSNREQLKGGLLLALEGTFNRMSRMARSMMFHNRILTTDEILESVDAVTAEGIQTLAQETFTDEVAAIAVLGPKAIEGDVSLGL